MSIKKSSSEESIAILEALAGEKLSLGGLLHSIRKGEGMSQVDFANLLGVSKQYLCDLEHQRRFVSPKIAQEFAIKLGYSVDQFVKLCLQDLIDRDGIHLIVRVDAA